MEADDWLRPPLEGKSPEERSVMELLIAAQMQADYLVCVGKMTLQVSATSRFNIIKQEVSGGDLRIASVG